MRKITLVALVTLGALISTPTWAGRSCEATHPPKAITVERALTMAQRTYEALQASGQKVVVLARAGQDLSKYGLHYSHLGFAYQQTLPQGGYEWRVLHKLNQCGSADAAVYRQGLGEFFLDDLWRLEAAWVELRPEVQERLLLLLNDEPKSLSLHHRPYSVVSYAWGTKYQQSNQWAIETLALALEPGANSRTKAQAWLQLKAYQPTTLKIGPLTRLGGRMTAANVAFDDHPNEKRFSDRIETVTVDSVFDWLTQSGLGASAIALKL